MYVFIYILKYTNYLFNLLLYYSINKYIYLFLLYIAQKQVSIFNKGKSFGNCKKFKIKLGIYNREVKNHIQKQLNKNKI